DGDPVTYSISVTNAGPSDAQNVVVTDVAPNFSEPLSVTQSQGSHTAIGATVYVTFGTIPAGGTATATLLIMYNQSGDPINGAFVNSSTPDLNSNNNTASVATSVVEPSIVAVGATVTATAGQLFNG